MRTLSVGNLLGCFRNNRPFSFLVLGDTVSQLGSGVSSFALMWWILDTTGSALKMGVVLVIMLTTHAILGPAVGLLVDRVKEKRLILLASDLISATAVFAIAVLISTGYQHIHLYYLLVFLKTVAILPSIGAKRVIIKAIVSPDSMENAAAVNTFARSGASGLGPVVGGMLIAWWGVPITLFVDSASYLIAAATRFMISLDSVQSPAPKVEDTEAKVTFMEGLRYFLRQKTILWLFSVVSLLHLFLGSFGMTMMVFVKQDLLKGASTLGAIKGTILLTIFLGSLVLSLVRLPKSYKNLILFGAFNFVSIPLFFMGQMKVLPLAFVTAACFGLSESVVGTVVEGMMINNISESKMGRVSTLTGTLHTALAPLSVIIAAALLQRYSAGQVYQLMAVCVSLTSILLLCVPGLRDGVARVIYASDKP